MIHADATRRSLVLAALTTSLVACATADTVTLPVPPPLERPAFAVGDRWVFTGPSGRSEMTYQGRRGDTLVFQVVFQPTSGTPVRGETLYSAELSHVKEARVENRPDDGELRFPLAVGRSWRHQFVRTVSQGGASSKEEHVSVEAKVAAYERIRVPAGELDAFRIESIVTSPSLSQKATYWYAPAVRTVIRYRAETAAGRTGLILERAQLTEFEAAR
jgi:hypothetical protein